MKLVTIIRTHRDQFVFGLIESENVEGHMYKFTPFKNVENIKDVEKIEKFLTVKEFCEKKKRPHIYNYFLDRLKTWTGAKQIWIHKRSTL